MRIRSGRWPLHAGSPVRLFIPILTSVVAVAPLKAQQVGSIPLDSGTLVRITLLHGHAVRGRLLEPFQPSASPAFVFCSYPAAPCMSRTDSHVQSVPTMEVTALEVAAGSHWLKGGLIGAGIGTALGGGADYLCRGLSDSPSECSHASVIILGALWGFGLGALFGSTSPRWIPAP